MEKQNQFTAIIPVRSGSRRLKNKNVSSFAGKNLLTHKIDQLKKVAKIDKILVSSNCNRMLEMAFQCGVDTHLRAEQYCDEKTQPFGAVVSHICENTQGENIIWSPCTSPLVSSRDYTESIDVYLEQLEKGFDSLMSVEKFKRYLWSDTGPINYELGLKHVPSQELPSYFIVTDGIMIAPRMKMIEWNYFHGNNPYKYELSKSSSIDIDDFWDLECAKSWFSIINQEKE